MAKKILIVEDDRVAARLAEELLSKSGYQVQTVYDGIDALVEIKKTKFDLIVLDVMLPEMNGYDVCYQLRFNDEFEKTPILLLTGRDSELTDGLGERSNISYIQKPINKEIFLKMVEEILSQ